jgi:hypothetical protein
MTPTIRPAVIAAVLVWLSAELVLQVHGLRFWAEHGGWQGWMWSLAIGVVSVWFWLHRSSVVRWVFGTLASLLLLLGPLWQVGSPLVAAIEAREAQQGAVTLRCQLLRNTETELTATLRTYLHNSEARSGWAPELSRVRGELAATRAELSALASTPPAVRLAWLSAAVIVLQMVALIVLQVAAVIALNAIRAALALPLSHRSPSSPKSHALAQQTTKTTTAPPSQRNTTTETTTIRLRIATGHYGATPTIRKVMEAEARRYQIVGPIFKALVAEGVLALDGKTYRLSGSGNA